MKRAYIVAAHCIRAVSVSIHLAQDAWSSYEWTKKGHQNKIHGEDDPEFPSADFCRRTPQAKSTFICNVWSFVTAHCYWAERAQIQETMP